MVVGAENRDGRGGLGQPVRVDETGLREEREGPLHNGARGARAPVREVAQCRCARVGTRHGLDDAGEHGRHEHGVGDTFAAYGGQPLPRVEGGQVDDPAAGVEVREQVGQACHVVRRDRDQRGVARLGRPELLGAEDVRKQMPVA